MTGTIFITGARGKTGREVIEQLSQHSDVTVRGGSSQDTSTHDILSASTIVQFDWNDRSTWPTAVEGVDAIFLMRPDVPNVPELITDLISHAPNAHIVL
ncbi:MAG: NAD(P)H-binding protein, partial [Propionibacteriales bacterium]|nr:NAD(P)H-binding protein [Propionibacteriales bacterium]